VSQSVTYSEFFREKEKLEKKLCSLLKRNKSLARLIFLKAPYLWSSGITEETIKKALPKRGRQPDNEMSVKLIMKLLHCSRRAALDYKAAYDLIRFSEKVGFLMMSEAATMIDKKMSNYTPCNSV